MTDRVGLANLGNTCFLNVVLQALRISPPIVTSFLKDKAKPLVLRDDSKKKELVSAFQTLIKDIWSIEAVAGSRPSLVPRNFFFHLHRVLRDNDEYWYRPGQQCDAAEALQYVLNSLHDGLYKRVRMEVTGLAVTDEEQSHVKAIKSWAEFFGREYSSIVSNFNGQHQIKITCSECGTVSERYEPWLMIKAPIPGSDVVGGPAPSMKQCLDAAYAPETLDDYHCDKCKGKKKATITTLISHMPPVAIVSLKRFTNAGHKVRGDILWDLDGLDFAPWAAFRRDPLTNDRDPPLYETYAVIEHHGSLHGGHYRMFGRMDATKWVEYDDSSFSEVSPDRVITADSYIALMIPKKSAAAMRREMAESIAAVRGMAAEA